MQRMVKLGCAAIFALLLSCTQTLEPDLSEHSSSSGAPLSSISVSSSSAVSALSSNSESSSSSGAQLSSASASNSSIDLLGIAVTDDSEFATLFANQASAVQVLARAHVTRLLKDDEVGDKHQQFIVALASGQTLKVAHNIDLSQRVPITVGDEVYMYGEYAYNAQGGVIHWTHKDPDGSHVAGWIWHRGLRYQ